MLATPDSRRENVHPVSMPRPLHSLAVILATLVAATASAQAPVKCPAPLVEIPNSYSLDTLRLAIDPGYGIKPVDSTLALTALSVVNENLVLPKPLALPPVITQW